MMGGIRVLNIKVTNLNLNNLISVAQRNGIDPEGKPAL